MSGSIIIEGKVLGKKKPLFAEWSIPYPPDLNRDGDLLDERLQGDKGTGGCAQISLKNACELPQ